MAFIAGAKESLDIAVQELDSEVIAKRSSTSVARRGGALPLGVWWGRRWCGLASSARERASRRGRGCGWRGGGRSRVRVLVGRRRGPRGASGGAVGEYADVAAQAVVACPAKRGAAAFARFDRDGRHAGVGGEAVAVWVAVAVVAISASRPAAQTTLLGSRKEREEDLAVGVARTAPAIWLVSWRICSTIGLSAATSPSTVARRASASSSR